MLLNIKKHSFNNFSLIKIELPNTFIIKNKFNCLGPLSQNAQTQLIKQMLKTLKIKSEIKQIFKKTTKIESLCLKSNNYSIFFSYNEKLKNNEKRSNDSTTNDLAIVVAKFKNFKDLITFCKNIYLTFESIYLFSKLYQFNGQSFILTLYTTSNIENDLTALLVEFNAITEKGKFQAAIIAEHCQLIFAQNAIEKISTCKI